MVWQTQGRAHLLVSLPTHCLTSKKSKRGRAVALYFIISFSYKSVSFLECDVGQCEFTVSGLVSLHCITDPVHGPAFVHQRTPKK